MYVPLKNQEDAYCQRCAWEGQTANSCDSIRGESYCLFERGSFTFGQGKWNKVQYSESEAKSHGCLPAFSSAVSSASAPFA